ncbi:hypothetical protein DRE_04040 [Drechslerella stenobrocha 248]|uniref:Uncharacterized protein n=1 Tax=Drechslerella stenobrocha 248 TaxID=1043628 RepID=W7ICG3_9PEZI|nr:hypothetical protein DRE_04040 [Drechslerella stenobrocha 248]
MSSNAAIPPDPVLHRPHADEQHPEYGYHVRVATDPEGGPTTISRNRNIQLNWESLPLSARNMFAELAGSHDVNRYQILVESTLTNWAEKMSPGHPNRLPDGNPTYLQDDVLPVIKAYVNRVPKPGVSGSPIPPALPMPELEALDYLHHHQALPYQQGDYGELFNELPDGFVWHPVWTLVGVRALDHRTLFEFRAYKHFWAIHKDEKSIREISTKDDPTWEVSIFRPDCEIDFTGIVPGGFHNMMVPPTGAELRRKLNDAQKKQPGRRPKSTHTPALYVRYANNTATVLADHHNDPDIFDGDGIPRLREVLRVPFQHHSDTEKFLSSFTKITRATINRLPTLLHTRAAAEIVAAEEKARQAGDTEYDTAAEIAAQFVNAVENKARALGSENPVEAANEAMRTLQQQMYIPELEANRTGIASTSLSQQQAIGTMGKLQLDASDLSAIDAKIKQLMLEQENPRQLPSVSKLTGAAYSSDLSAMKTPVVGTVVFSKDSSGKIGAKSATVELPIANEPKPAPHGLPGAYFASSTNRHVLMKNLLSSDDPDYIPSTGPGARSWMTLKEEKRDHPIKLRSNIIEESAKEHIKQMAVITLQQTIYFYLIIGERLKRKKIPVTAAEASCHAKVTEILQHGQRVTIEYLTGNGKAAGKATHYIRATGVARDYDQPMESDRKANAIGISKFHVALNEDEQAAYWRVMADTKDFWAHSATCGCKSPLLR